MPVREFTGELDKPKVREFTGTLDQQKPPYPGFRPLDMNALFARSRAGEFEPGFDPQSAFKAVADRTVDALPLIGGVAGSFAGPAGTGWGALAGSALAGGVGTAIGEAGKEAIQGDVDPVKVAKTGAGAAAGGFAVGAALKGLGALAHRLFGFRPNTQMQQAIKFAKDQDAPFPLSSAAPGSGPARVQQGSRALLAGDIRTHQDAAKVAQFLNREVDGQATRLAPKASPVDDASLKGQEFLRTVFEPGETAYKGAFNAVYDDIGDAAPVPLGATKQAVKGAMAALKERGELKQVYRRLAIINKNGAETLSVKELDELYGGLIKDGMSNRHAMREVEKVLGAIAKDIDDMSGGFAASLEDARKAREAYKALREIPSLSRLSQEMGGKAGARGSRDWINTLFANPDGRALSKFRELNPELYHELADSWLAMNLSKFSSATSGNIGRTLDGRSLRDWYVNNERAIKIIFGAPQAKALDNFSLYAQYMGNAARFADDANKALSPKEMLFRGAGELAAGYQVPLFVTGEPTAYVLAKGLADPKSTLFRLFTEGFKPGTREAMLKTGQIAGQQAGREIADGGD